MLRRLGPTCLPMLASATLVLAGSPMTVELKEIRANDQIVGSVQGVPRGQHDQYKVVVYVHTDQWYVHPFAGQGEGASYAWVKADGSWSIRTVNREFKANKIAVLVVTKSVDVPPKLKDLDAVPHAARTVRNLEGTPDYGKL